jgi:hypothetical protein
MSKITEKLDPSITDEPEPGSPISYLLAQMDEESTAIKPLLDPRPKVQLPGDGRLLSDFATDLGKAIKASPIFQRDGKVFTISPIGDRLVLMTPNALRSWLETVAVCFRVRSTGSNEVIEFRKTMSKGDAEGVLSSPQFISQLREIRRFNQVRMPVRRFDGNINLLTEGYDESSKTYTATNSPTVIQRMPLDMAKQIIDELLAEFVFADDTRSKAVALAGMLTVYAGGILPDKSLRPCFVFLANAEGAGKSLLVKLATVPVLGMAPNSPSPKCEDEMRKVLLSAVMEGQNVLCFDNFKGHLASASLEGFLTSQDWSGRILGGQATYHGTNDVTVFVTGNGATVSPDMRRRSLFCELFMEAERAEDRQFQQQLEVPEILKQRTEILSAMWALVDDWSKGGQPDCSRHHSSFQEWTSNIAAIVEHHGYGCAVETAHIDACGDTDTEDMRELCKAMCNGSLLKAVSFDELVGISRENGLFTRLIPDKDDDKLDYKARSIFGKILKSFDRRLIGSHRFTIQGKGHNRKFQVELKKQ